MIPLVFAEKPGGLSRDPCWNSPSEIVLQKGNAEAVSLPAVFGGLFARLSVWSVHDGTLSCRWDTSTSSQIHVISHAGWPELFVDCS